MIEQNLYNMHYMKNVMVNKNKKITKIVNVPELVKVLIRMQLL
jgi:hypothetical protein